MTKDQYKDLNDWMNECRNNRHWELVYVWSQLVLDHAFLFVGSTTPVGMENASAAEKRASVVGQYHLSGGRDEGGHVPISKNELVRDIMEGMGRTHKRYMVMKSALTGDSQAAHDHGLNLAQEQFPERILEISSIHHRPLGRPGFSGTGVQGNFLEEDGLTIGQRRKKLRDKAFEHRSPSKRQQLAAAAATAEENSEDSDLIEELAKHEERKKKRKKSDRGRGRPQVKTRERKPSSKQVGEKKAEASLADKDLEEVIKSCGAYKEDPSLLRAKSSIGESRLFAIADRIAESEKRIERLEVNESDTE